MSTPSPERQLAIAVIDVALAISDRRRAQVLAAAGNDHNVLIPASRMRALIEAMEVAHPGAIDRAAEISKQEGYSR